MGTSLLKQLSDLAKIRALEVITNCLVSSATWVVIQLVVIMYVISRKMDGGPSLMTKKWRYPTHPLLISVICMFSNEKIWPKNRSFLIYKTQLKHYESTGRRLLMKIVQAYFVLVNHIIEFISIVSPLKINVLDTVVRIN